MLTFFEHFMNLISLKSLMLGSHSEDQSQKVFCGKGCVCVCVCMYCIKYNRDVKEIFTSLRMNGADFCDRMLI